MFLFIDTNRIFSTIEYYYANKMLLDLYYKTGAVGRAFDWGGAIHKRTIHNIYVNYAYMRVNRYSVACRRAYPPPSAQFQLEFPPHPCSNRHSLPVSSVFFAALVLPVVSTFFSSAHPTNL
jgi:hypothetical protein